MKDITKEELIKIFEDQIDNLKDLRYVLKFDAEEIKLKIDYSVLGSDILHPNFTIAIYNDEFDVEDGFIDEDEADGFKIQTELFNVVIPEEKARYLGEKIYSIVEKLEQKNILLVH